MGSLSVWHWLIVVLIVMLFFGRGRVSALMADVGRGVRNLRSGLGDDDESKGITGRVGGTEQGGDA